MELSARTRELAAARRSAQPHAAAPRQDVLAAQGAARLRAQSRSPVPGVRGGRVTADAARPADAYLRAMAAEADAAAAALGAFTFAPAMNPRSRALAADAARPTLRRGLWRSDGTGGAARETASWALRSSAPPPPPEDEAPPPPPPPPPRRTPSPWRASTPPPRARSALGERPPLRDSASCGSLGAAPGRGSRAADTHAERMARARADRSQRERAAAGADGSRWTAAPTVPVEFAFSSRPRPLLRAR